MKRFNLNYTDTTVKLTVDKHHLSEVRFHEAKHRVIYCLFDGRPLQLKSFELNLRFTSGLIFPMFNVVFSNKLDSVNPYKYNKQFCVAIKGDLDDMTSSVSCT